jgi:molybdopterin-guanine dinucleotide biosynthesis protein A
MDEAVIGVILAGGAGRRMGSDKALVELRGRPLASWVADAARQVTQTVVAVGRPGHLGDLACHSDAIAGRLGPLSGLVTGLELARSSRVLLVAVDQPLVRVETLLRLLDEPGQAVVPLDGGTRQVTCAVYPGTWAGEARRELEGNGSIQSLLDRLPHAEVQERTWRSWGEDGRSWFSVDTPDDLTTAELMMDADR